MINFSETEGNLKIAFDYLYGTADLFSAGF